MGKSFPVNKRTGSKEPFIMSNPNSSGPQKPAAPPDDDRTSSRPADAEDDEPRDTERDGQGQSGYGAGRRGDDPALRNQNKRSDRKPRE